MKHIRPAHEVLKAVEQALVPKPRLAARGRLSLKQIRGASLSESPLDEVAGLLRTSRGYFAVTIYLEAGDRLLRMASAGPASRCESMRMGEGNVGQAAKTAQAKLSPDVSRDPQYVKVFDETRSELVTPVKIGTHVIGVVDVESERVNGLSYEDHALLDQVAPRLARFLSGRGKYLVMKAREAKAWDNVRELPHPVAPKPGATRVGQPESLRAAAGEKARS